MAHADVTKAEPMRAYMKSAMPFLGIAAPRLDRLAAEAVKAHPCADPAELAGTMLALWREARYREERYAALELPRLGRVHARLVNLELLPVAQEMITTGAWWDLVDDISGSLLARLLERHPIEVKAALRRWAMSDDLWLRRAAMLAQRGVKADSFDAELFYETILPSIGNGRFAGEFFIRKGIGWALRERAYQAPDEVRAFCAEYAQQLAPLTVREALRRIDRAHR